MVKTKYVVYLTEKEEQSLKSLIKKGTHSARVLTRARILLMANNNKQKMKDAEIITSLGIAVTTPHDIRKRFCEGGMERALYDAPRPGGIVKVTSDVIAIITATACTNPPTGYSQWSMDLITKEVNKKLKDELGRTTIWEVLIQHDLKPWREKNVVHTKSYF
jgi:hypothetical protein